jgi:transposase-like protein
VAFAPEVPGCAELNSAELNSAELNSRAVRAALGSAVDGFGRLGCCTIRDVARSIGVHERALSNWVNRAKDGALGQDKDQS